MKKNYSLLIFLIKANRPFAIAWAVLIVAVYTLFYNITPMIRDYYVFPFLFIIGAALLYPIPFTLFTRNQYKKVNSILFTDCDPFGYIDIYRRIIDELVKTKRPPALSVYKLNLSAGLIAAGSYAEAYEILGNFKYFKNNRIGRLSNVVRYNNLCSACLKLGRTDEAKYYLDCLAGSVAALSPFYRDKYMKYVDLAQYGINIAKSIFDNAENFYNEAFYKAVNDYERAGSKFCLGKIYLHFGDTARAKEAFEYVVKHGNKLHIVEEAKERLDEPETHPARGGL